MARGELLGAFALSEPDAGSDAASLRTQAVRDGDGWVLNGTKAWVTQGTKAGVILAMARTDTPDDRRGARGISAFIVTPDLPGFSVGKKEDKMGLRASPTVQLVFDNLRVPADQLLGEAGQGLRLRAAVARATAAWGSPRRPWHRARRHSSTRVHYAGERHQFGKPIRGLPGDPVQAGRHGGARHPARALLHAAATAKDRGEPIDAVQLHGQALGERDGHVGDHRRPFRSSAATAT